MQTKPKLPKGVKWDDVELVPEDEVYPDKVKEEVDDLLEVVAEVTYVARNKKTGEIYK